MCAELTVARGLILYLEFSEHYSLKTTSGKAAPSNFGLSSCT